MDSCAPLADEKARQAVLAAVSKVANLRERVCRAGHPAGAGPDLLALGLLGRTCPLSGALALVMDSCAPLADEKARQAVLAAVSKASAHT
jgi:hypothetical protein